MPVICLDTETTGDGPEDRVLQLAFLIAEEGHDIELFNSLCKPAVPVKFDAMAVHHITPECLENKPPLAETGAFRRLELVNVRENYLVIQNAKFDIEMLSRDGFSSRMKLIDTLKVAQHTLTDSPKHALQYLRYSLGLYKKEDQFLEMITAHDALGDVIVLYNLLQYFLENGLSLDDMVELTKNPVLFKTFSFGKYRGQLIEKVKDRSYLEWCLKNMSDLSDDWRFTLEHYVKK
jgi:DNA polymerase III epsilon subunit-like protein